MITRMIAAAIPGVSEAQVEAALQLIKVIDWKNAFAIVDVFTMVSPSGEVQLVDRATGVQLRDEYGWTKQSHQTAVRICYTGPNPATSTIEVPGELVKMNFYIPLLTVHISVDQILNKEE